MGRGREVKGGRATAFQHHEVRRRAAQGRDGCGDGALLDGWRGGIPWSGMGEGLDEG